MPDPARTRRRKRSCRDCLFFRDAVPFPGNIRQTEPCEKALASWYPDRGYGACPRWVAKPLSDEDY